MATRSEGDAKSLRGADHHWAPAVGAALTLGLASYEIAAAPPQLPTTQISAPESLPKTASATTRKVGKSRGSSADVGPETASTPASRAQLPRELAPRSLNSAELELLVLHARVAALEAQVRELLLRVRAMPTESTVPTRQCSFVGPDGIQRIDRRCLIQGSALNPRTVPVRSSEACRVPYSVGVDGIRRINAGCSVY